MSAWPTEHNTGWYKHKLNMKSKLRTLFWRCWYKVHKQPSRYTRAEALARAKEYGLEWEVLKAMEHGCNPDEALQDWDIYPYKEK